MLPARYRPTSGHVFVCVNRRREGDPLGAGCAERGEALYAALKQGVARGGMVSSVWVTRTHCLGVCPPRGAAVAISPHGDLFTEASPEDAPALLRRARETR